MGEGERVFLYVVYLCDVKRTRAAGDAGNGPASIWRHIMPQVGPLRPDRPNKQWLTIAVAIYWR